MKVPIGNNLKLDVNRLLETRLILSASSGGGKSMTGRTILEKTHDLVPQIVLDKDGEFPSLREKFDRYVIAGKGWDIPLSAKTAELLARKVLENNISILLDLYDLKHDEKHQFVKLFIDALVNSPRELWAPRLVVITESHHFCPENGEGSSIAKDSIIELLEAGRKRGLGTILDTQRLSKLDKSAAAECQNKLFGLTNWDDDRKRAGKELGFSSKEDVLSLRDMEPGEFYAIGPALSKQVIKTQILKATTSHPKIGRKMLTAPRATATKKIKKMLEKLKDIPQEAEVELKTVAQLKGRIQELEIEVKKLPKVQLQPVAMHTVPSNLEAKIRQDEQAKSKGLIQKLKVEYEKSLAEQKSMFHKALGSLLRNFETAVEAMKKLGVTPPATSWVDALPKPGPLPKLTIHKVEVLRPPVPSRRVPIAAHGADGMGSPPEGMTVRNYDKCARAIVAFLALGSYKAWSKVQIAVGSGYSVTSGGFLNSLSSLRQGGIITGKPNEIRVDMNRAQLELGDIPKLEGNVKEQWLSHVDKCAKAIYAYLAQNSGLKVTKEQLAEATGYRVTSGGFLNSLSRLNTLQVIKKENGEICLNPEIRDL